MSKSKVKNILVLTYWGYKDALVQNYTLPYLKIIMQQLSPESRLFLVTFENFFYRMDEKERSEADEQLAKHGISLISFSYHSFGMNAIFRMPYVFFKLLLLCFSKKIKYIHAWCTPAGSLGYLLSKATGIPLVLDSYEPHAESMVENGSWKRNSLAFRVLFLFENWQTAHASFIIGLTKMTANYSLETYHILIKKMFVKPACVNLDLFSKEKSFDPNLASELEIEDKIVLVYAGKFGGIYLDQEVFDFIKVAEQHWGDQFRALLLTSLTEVEFDLRLQNSKLSKKTVMKMYVEPMDVPKYLALADFAINPVKSVPSKRFCTSIKDGEYWASGLPVVITRNISDDSDIIEENEIGVVLQNLNQESYQDAILKMEALLKTNVNGDLSDKIRAVARRERSFDNAVKIYSEIY